MKSALVVAAWIAAVAHRPPFAGAGACATGEGTDIFLLLDASASMGDVLDGDTRDSSLTSPLGPAALAGAAIGGVGGGGGAPRFPPLPLASQPQAAGHQSPPGAALGGLPFGRAPKGVVGGSVGAGAASPLSGI